MRFQNPFEMARATNLLGIRRPQPQPQPMEPIPRIPRPRIAAPLTLNGTMEPMQSDEDRYMEEFDRLRGSAGPGIQAYRQHLEALPNREDYKPGWMTRIASALSGLGAGYRNPGEGVEVAMGLNQAGYQNAIQDYANKGIGLRERADMEQEELDSKIRALQQARAMGLKYDEFELKRLETEAKMDTDAYNANSARIRAEAYAKAQNRPGFDAHPQEDGSVLYVNKADPSIRQIVPAKTVAAGQLGVSRSNAATARGQLGVAQGNLRNSVRRTNIYEQDVWNRHNRGILDDMNQGGRAPSPDQQQDAEDLALRQMASDPVWQPFIGSETIGNASYPKVVDDDGTDDYQDFLEELNLRVAQILKGSPRRPRR